MMESKRSRDQGLLCSSGYEPGNGEKDKTADERKSITNIHIPFE